jgi:hypothetical protein
MKNIGENILKKLFESNVFFSNVGATLYKNITMLD